MGGRTSNILLIEDDKNDQVFIETALKKVLPSTATIRCAENANAAIEYLSGFSLNADRAKNPFPTAVLTDLNMPNGDGFAFFQFIRKHPEWRVTPTIVLTASSDPDDIRSAYAFGANAYHVKPCSFSGLCRLMSLIVEYWNLVEVPGREASGRLAETESRGKLGSHYPSLPLE